MGCASQGVRVPEGVLEHGGGMAVKQTGGRHVVQGEQGNGDPLEEPYPARSVLGMTFDRAPCRPGQRQGLVEVCDFTCYSLLLPMAMTSLAMTSHGAELSASVACIAVKVCCWPAARSQVTSCSTLCSMQCVIS